MKKSISFVLLCFLVAFNINSQTTNAQHAKAKYIFYFIGDGMGLSQVNSTEAYLTAMQDSDKLVKLAMNRFPVQGFYTTYAANRFITGSAAAATAMATGHKTSINTISMDKTKQHPLETVAEFAKEEGYKVGIVSSVSIDHATPACFYAHQPDRNMYYNISLDLSKSGFDYFAGGGFKHPEGDGKIDKSNTNSNVGLGGDPVNDHQKNSLDVAKKLGYTFVNTVKDFNKLKAGDDKVIATAPRLEGGKALPYSIDQNGKDISLDQFTHKGIELLDNPKGFFMMVEGGKIDWACHANDAATAIKEVLQFDRSIQEAVKFYKKHPDETLIVVAADHETGGMAMGFSGSHYQSAFKLLNNQNISYEGFTDLIADYRKEHTSNYNVNDGLDLVKKYFGLGDADKGLPLSDYEVEQLKTAFTKSMNKEKLSGEEKEQFYLLYGSYDPLTVTACHILAQKAGIGWTTYSHTASPVPVRAIGVGSELFGGYYDNTDLSKRVKSVIQ